MAVPRGSQPRRGTPISLIAIHTSEGARTAASLARYLDQPEVEASYHVLCDDTETLAYLADEVACWALLSGNPRALQLCFTAFAAWPRSEWLAHDRMLRQGAIVVRRWCELYAIPARKLTPAQVGADQSGICGHWDWTLGKREGTHTDPGPNFPWDRFIDYIQEVDAMPTPAEIWAHPLDGDPYVAPDGKRTGPKPASVYLLHGAANAAYAKERADKALAELAALRAALPRMIAEEIRTAIADGVLDVDISVLDRTKEG